MTLCFSVAFFSSVIVALCLSLLVTPVANAFSPATPYSFQRPSSSSALQLPPSSAMLVRLAAVKTGRDGQAASSREEDLMLTVAIILDHERRSTTVPTDQFMEQMKEYKVKERQVQEHPEDYIAASDTTVPFDARTRLAYGRSDQTQSFAKFKASYVRKSINEVKAKKKNGSKRELLRRVVGRVLTKPVRVLRS